MSFPTFPDRSTYSCRSPLHSRGDITSGVRRSEGGRSQSAASRLHVCRHGSLGSDHDRDWRPVTGNRAKLFEALDRNCRETGVRLFDLESRNQGIVHIIGPERITQPGQTVVCGDSHTSTHGAMGALAFGIGTSEVETALATQCLPQFKSKSMLVRIDGKRSIGISAKDLMLAVIEKVGFAGGTGYVIEYGGDAVRSLSIEERMTLCSMSIECGARAGMVSPDESTIRVSQGASVCANRRRLRCGR